MYICPKCKEQLKLNINTLSCVGGHSFDKARQGYVNLLLSSVASHGDNKDMVLARRAFLSLGYYKRLADEVADIIKEYAKCQDTLVDLGCGEGYYTNLLKAALGDKIEVYGLDVSKEAVRRAAGQSKSVNYSVASVYSAPFKDGSFDIALNLFAPLAIEETGRILKDNGIFIMVFPDTEHLYSLKAAVYENPYKNTPLDDTLNGFELINSREIKYDFTLKDSSDIKNLFMMTPYAYRTSKADLAKLEALNELTVGAHFRILVYKKANL